MRVVVLTAILFLPLLLSACASGGGGSRYITGPRGGCYYINSNGNKTYTDHSNC